LFFHEEKADGGKEGYVEQISLLLSVNPNDTVQEPLRLGSDEISPEPVINGVLHSQPQPTDAVDRSTNGEGINRGETEGEGRNLFDETVNGTSIGGEIGGVSVGLLEEPEQIVGELGGHVVDVNPKGKGERVVRIRVQPVHLGAINGVVELGDEVLLSGVRGVVGKGVWRGSGGEEAVEGGDEGGFGIGNVDIGGGKERGAERREREEDEEERESEKEEEESGSRFGSRDVLSGHCYVQWITAPKNLQTQHNSYPTITTGNLSQILNTLVFGYSAYPWVQIYTHF